VKAPLGPKRWQNRPVNVSPSLDGIRRVLARQASPLNPDVASDQTAAVAAILREAPAGTDLLFIRRAEHPADPWSGDMAWPGGHVDPGDGGPLATAVREAREELALDLERDGTFLGGLPVVRTALVPNDEVQEAVWVPLPFLLEPSNRGSFIWTRGIPLTMACYRYEGRLIWGLTMKMLDNLLDLLSETGFPR
jgi:hypothetical protein